MTFTSVSPTTGEALRSFATLSKADLDTRLERAASAFHSYRRSSFADRAAAVVRVAEILLANKDRYARLIAAEMGKLLPAAQQEVEKCAWVCRYYAEKAKDLLAPDLMEVGAHETHVRYQPLGAILAVMPWNFPFWQVIRVAAPNLMAGNVLLLKHAPNVPECALALEGLFDQAGFPAGAFQALLIESNWVAGVIGDARIAGVTFTGSALIGKEIASEAGWQLKKSVLELGGSDPFIVLSSADVDRAVESAVKARNINSGQSCIAAKRFIIAEEVYKQFERQFVSGMQALRIGDPFDTETEVGPLATERGVQKLEDQVQQSVAAGARILTGGKRLDRPGNFYEPTVLTDIPKGCPAYREELFGPVASLFRVRDIDEAIALANDTEFGLGASVWTNDETDKLRSIDEIEAGSIFINGTVKSDPRLPFGGVKRSGYGRELGPQGIREFVNVKTAQVRNWRTS